MDEREKLAFISSYEILCRRYGAMVIHIDKPEDEYSPFAVAKYSDSSLYQQLEELRLEPVRTITEEDEL